ncbi:hypothetical protein C8J57DRAFT_1309090 [Mycena rebaudengoi]|nr:hypothetical protein C8J57DRAFT_1309090 [Mycena rebaudengoi]
MVRWFCVWISGTVVHRSLARESQRSEVGQVCARVRGQWRCVGSRHPNHPLHCRRRFRQWMCVVTVQFIPFDVLNS